MLKYMNFRNEIHPFRQTGGLHAPQSTPPIKHYFDSPGLISSAGSNEICPRFHLKIGCSSLGLPLLDELVWQHHQGLMCSLICVISKCPFCDNKSKGICSETQIGQVRKTNRVMSMHAFPPSFLPLLKNDKTFVLFSKAQKQGSMRKAGPQNTFLHMAGYHQRAGLGYFLRPSKHYLFSTHIFTTSREGEFKKTFLLAEMSTKSKIQGWIISQGFMQKDERNSTQVGLRPFPSPVLNEKVLVSSRF